MGGATSTTASASEAVANTYNNRGIALGKLGRYDLALRALQCALDIRIPLLGANHRQVLSTLHNLANVHQQAGQLQTALTVFNKAKELGKLGTEVSGTTCTCTTCTCTCTCSTQQQDLVQMARICTAMGHVYYQAEQWLDARDAYQDALETYLDAFSSSSSSSNNNNPNNGFMCKQELINLQRDIFELDQRLLCLQQHSE
jgi:tetratricopeptide (TPR) repeat protein